METGSVTVSRRTMMLEWLPLVLLVAYLIVTIFILPRFGIET